VLSAGEVRPDTNAGHALLDEFAGWLADTMAREASDLHLKVGAPPKLRETGKLVPIDRPALTPDETLTIADAIVPADRAERFERAGEVDFAYSVANLGRFRANVFRQRGSVSMVLRRLRFGGPRFDELGLPDSVRSLAEESRGLVLVTGPTGSGKTTTLASMIEHINQTKPVHVVTIEDPIEVLFRDAVASIDQREVGNDTESFPSALRAALRQDPDVILIGEMRDTDTVRAALQAAETGHLVLSTLHTVDSTCQRLVPTLDGRVVPGLEILVNTGRVAERIAHADKTHEIREIVADGAYYGMRTFDQSLLALVQEGRVGVDAAMEASTAPHDFQLMLQQAGIPVPRTTRA
jgi:twitching motility protein PilT